MSDIKKKDVSPHKVVTGAFCDPVWKVSNRRTIHSLPDISTYKESDPQPK